MLAQYIQPITEVVSTNIKTGLLAGSGPTGTPPGEGDKPSTGEEGDIEFGTEDLAKDYGWTASGSDNDGWDEW